MAFRPSTKDVPAQTKIKCEIMRNVKSVLRKRCPVRAGLSRKYILRKVVGLRTWRASNAEQERCEIAAILPIGH